LPTLLQVFDKTVLDIFNKDIKNTVFDVLFPLITRFGEIVVVFPLCLLIYFLDKKNGKRITTLLVIAYLLSRISSLILKYLTHRPRPFMTYPDINVIGRATFSSFPSGHATLVAALAVVLGRKYKDWQWLFWLIVALVSISRMYMGLHYPTDTVVGIIIGLVIGYTTNTLETLYDRLRKKEA